jgi:hypothetical protein
MVATVSSPRTSPEIPSLTHTNDTTNASTPMPASPTSKNGESSTDPEIKEAVKEAEDGVDVKELVEELKDSEGDDDPAVSHTPHIHSVLYLVSQRTRLGKRNQPMLFTGYESGGGRPLFRIELESFVSLNVKPAQHAPGVW